MKRQNAASTGSFSQVFHLLSRIFLPRGLKKAICRSAMTIAEDQSLGQKKLPFTLLPFLCIFCPTLCLGLGSFVVQASRLQLPGAGETPAPQGK
jgi:hypothetical protein